MRRFKVIYEVSVNLRARECIKKFNNFSKLHIILKISYSNNRMSGVSENSERAQNHTLLPIFNKPELIIIYL